MLTVRPLRLEQTLNQYLKVVSALLEASHKVRLEKSIVPTTTGAAKALTKIFPELSEVIGGCGIRVPVANGSLTDITFNVKENVTVNEVNEAFEKAAKSLELDPIEIRKRNLVTNFPYKTPTGITLDTGSYVQGLERMVEIID